MPTQVRRAPQRWHPPAAAPTCSQHIPSTHALCHPKRIRVCAHTPTRAQLKIIQARIVAQAGLLSGAMALSLATVLTPGGGGGGGGGAGWWACPLGAGRV
jgi:hypothetical protein